MPVWMIVAFVLLWAAGMGSTLLYRRHVQRRYPELAARLFPPLMEKSIRSDLAGMRFVLRREYRQLDDPAFVRISDLYFALTLATMAALAGIAAFVLVRV